MQHGNIGGTREARLATEVYELQTALARKDALLRECLKYLEGLGFVSGPTTMSGKLRIKIEKELADGQ